MVLLFKSENSGGSNFIHIWISDGGMSLVFKWCSVFEWLPIWTPFWFCFQMARTIRKLNWLAKDLLINKDKKLYIEWSRITTILLKMTAILFIPFSNGPDHSKTEQKDCHLVF